MLIEGANNQTNVVNRAETCKQFQRFSKRVELASVFISLPLRMPSDIYKIVCKAKHQQGHQKRGNPCEKGGGGML